jgi:hypothetical protein
MKAQTYDAHILCKSYKETLETLKPGSSLWTKPSWLALTIVDLLAEFVNEHNSEDEFMNARTT